MRKIIPFPLARTRGPVRDAEAIDHACDMAADLGHIAAKAYLTRLFSSGNISETAYERGWSILELLHKRRGK